MNADTCGATGNGPFGELLVCDKPRDHAGQHGQGGGTEQSTWGPARGATGPAARAAHHTLTIEPGEPGGMTLVGKIVFQDGSTATVYGDERVRVIAAAQRAIEQHLAHKQMATQPPERLYLDDHGEIIRTPSVSSDPRDGYALDDPKRTAFEGKW